MTKKRLLLIASLPLVTAAMILGVLAMLPPRPGVTKANFDRIEKGMTKAKVVEVFGRKGFISPRSGLDHGIWRADDGSEALIYFSHDAVTEKRWSGSKETNLDKIRRWLHLP